jgi:hypothetical protein
MPSVVNATPTAMTMTFIRTTLISKAYGASTTKGSNAAADRHGNSPCPMNVA